MADVTIAIPVRDGLPRLSAVLDAIAGQRTTRDVGVLVCDSGSCDGSGQAARRAGADVFAIDPRTFSHGGTRNLLAERAKGDVVAFLTQDAVPAHDRWLEELLGGFDLAEDVALSFGPYRPLPDASTSTARELDAWFGSLAPACEPRVDRLAPDERAESPLVLVGRRGFFTDANGAVRRECWAHVPYRPVAYAEDQQLAVDMLRAGYAKAYVPGAAVEHSHDYAPAERLRRSFDEGRGLHEVYGWRMPVGRTLVRDRVLIPARDDGRWLRARNEGSSEFVAGLARSLVYHAASTVGSVLGARADRVPAHLRRYLSLEGRA